MHDIVTSREPTLLHDKRAKMAIMSVEKIIELILRILAIVSANFLMIIIIV